VGLAQLDGAVVTRRQQLILAPVATMPHRTDSVNDISRRKPISVGDLRAAGLAAIQGAAFGKKFGPGRAMDRPIDTATAEQ
jgi:hypothetical protein